MWNRKELVNMKEIKINVDHNKEKISTVLIYNNTLTKL